MTRLGEQTVVLLDRQPTGTKDRYGAVVYAEVFTVIEGCSVTPRSSTESGPKTAPTVTGMTLLAPPGYPIGAADAVIYPPLPTEDPNSPWSGPRYEVDGEVGDWGEFVQAELQRST